jgi:N-acetylglutamate synthase-like GNAT family acetyltransferase
MNWEAVKQWLAEEGRSPAELTLVVRSQDALLSLPERFSLALQARLAGATLALLIDRPERLSFELLERLPLEAILLGYRVQPQLDHGGLLDSFLQRTRERGCQIYLDDPYALLDARWWEERGFHGRW